MLKKTASLPRQPQRASRAIESQFPSAVRPDGRAAGGHRPQCFGDSIDGPADDAAFRHVLNALAHVDRAFVEADCQGDALGGVFGAVELEDPLRAEVATPEIQNVLVTAVGSSAGKNEINVVA